MLRATSCIRLAGAVLDCPKEMRVETGRTAARLPIVGRGNPVEAVPLQRAAMLGTERNQPAAGEFLSRIPLQLAPCLLSTTRPSRRSDIDRYHTYHF